MHAPNCLMKLQGMAAGALLVHACRRRPRSPKHRRRSHLSCCRSSVAGGVAVSVRRHTGYPKYDACTRLRCPQIGRVGAYQTPMASCMHVNAGATPFQACRRCPRSPKHCRCSHFSCCRSSVAGSVAGRIRPGACRSSSAQRTAQCSLCQSGAGHG
jgi:hypothetical protein